MSFAAGGMLVTAGRSHFPVVPPSLSLQTSTTSPKGGKPPAASRLQLSKGNLSKLGGGGVVTGSGAAAPPAPRAGTGLPIPLPRAVPAQAQAVPAAARAKARAAAPRAGAKGQDAAVPRVDRRARTLVLGAVFAFVVTGSVVAAMQYRGSMAEGRSQQALVASLRQVHSQQNNFRVLNQRFATWPELEARGARLAPTQKVLRSNATSSHWFMSLFDRETGVVCDQTGELFDEEPGERRASCRTRSE